MKKTICILVFVTSLSQTGFCQAHLTDSTSFKTKISDTYNLYINTVGGASFLYNGAEYIGVYHGVLGNPLFQSNDFEIGFICYEGIRYNKIPLKYDLVTDEVITKGVRNESISLVREKIDSFYVMKHLFIKMGGDPVNLNLSTPHFYDLVYDGKEISMLVKREKIIKRALHAEDPSSFVNRNTYYVAMKNVFHSVGDKKTLKRLLSGKGEVMTSFWSNNKINFKKDPENTIRKAIEYYDQSKR